jgi:hypothetical protein
MKGTRSISHSKWNCKYHSQIEAVLADNEHSFGSRPGRLWNHYQGCNSVWCNPRCSDFEMLLGRTGGRVRTILAVSTKTLCSLRLALLEL